MRGIQEVHEAIDLDVLVVDLVQEEGSEGPHDAALVVLRRVGIKGTCEIIGMVA